MGDLGLFSGKFILAQPLVIKKNCLFPGLAGIDQLSMVISQNSMASYDIQLES